MSLRMFFKQCMMEFFIITVCVNVATAIIGPVLMPEAILKFDAFYSPLIGGFLGTLPSIILYSKQELNLRQTILRKVLHLVTLESLLTGVAFLYGNLASLSDALLFLLMVFLVYVAVTFISWVLENRDAKRINAGLKALQKRE